MDFPKFVPLVVSRFITMMIEGDERGPFGWKAALSSAEEDLSAKTSELSSSTSNNSNRLAKEVALARVHRDMLAKTVDNYKRLGTDGRMEECFDLLRDEFDDEQWKKFIRCADAARLDYSKYRLAIKSASELSKDIAVAADRLVNLLKRLEGTGLNNLPDELYSLSSLIEQTDHPHDAYSKRPYWRSMRRHILGERMPKINTDASGPNALPLESKTPIIEIRFIEPDEPPKVDPEEQRRDFLRYAWQQAPDVSQAIKAMGNAARQYKPKETGMIGAAIRPRKSSDAQNKEYLRAFGSLLADAHPRIPKCLKVLKAMAIAANVVIDDPNLIVTYDDVAKAVGKP